MNYRYMVPDVAYAVVARGEDRELRRCLELGLRPPDHSIPDFDFREPYCDLPAFPFSMGVRLMSLELKAILEECSGPQDRIDWVPCSVIAGGERLAYTIPIVSSEPPRLHPGLSSFDSSGRVIRWVLEGASLAGMNIIKVPKVRQGFVVAEQIMDRVLESNLVGVDWLTARVA